MKFRIIAGLLVLFLFLVLVLGVAALMAWLTDTALPSTTTTFVTGNTNFEITAEGVGYEGNPHGEKFRWETTQIRNFNWVFENSGSRDIFFRVRLEETLLAPTEAAWAVQDNPEKTESANKENKIIHVTYHLGEGEAAMVKTYKLFAGSHRASGTLKVWEADGSLLVEYTAHAPEMLEVHLAVTDSLDEIPANKNGSPVLYRFPFVTHFDEPEETFTFAIPMAGRYPAGALEGRFYLWSAPKTLYIVAHAALVGSESEEAVMAWTQSSCDFKWNYNEDDGYWYYTVAPVAPGDSVELCLTGCPQETGFYTVRLHAEAVQAQPGAAEINWGSDSLSLQAP